MYNLILKIQASLQGKQSFSFMFPICQSDQSLKDSCSLFSIETKHLLNSKYSLSCLTDSVHLYFSIAIILENWPVVSWMDFGTWHFEGHWVAQYREFGSKTLTDSAENMCQG